ncbi:MAG: succinate dehydrogenase cytochrome b subunit [Deltaproteobacteria bacterium]|nr:succinate dehydrogenase cytochrome b subunit [Deltaproteobacteria bacterium]MBW1960208.1 succinate dehydrogenase cytochrome b subunit [Deltaproteobacteria bacterium]MBW2150611.1 succinate dehydrogenase cytochrome b subunit [Deltaproteobacteria bacterium]
MNWFFEALTSSVGKKLLMAVTGLGFCGFLIAHLAGNVTMYGGGEAFNAYAAKLHSLGLILRIAEAGLVFFAIVHITTGAVLFFQNLRARPVRYHVKKTAGAQSLAAATMPYTGILVLLFVVNHLMDFSFVDKAHASIYQIVSEKFSNPLYVILYIVGMILVAVHVSHGLWSAFQTIGANHPKYMPFLRKMSIVFSILIGIGFGTLPIYVSLIS